MDQIAETEAKPHRIAWRLIGEVVFGKGNMGTYGDVVVTVGNTIIEAKLKQIGIFFSNSEQISL